MSHLSTDRLAAIADDTPTADEATHLAGCWDCRAEVAAYRRLARMSAMAPIPMEPLTAWSRLAPQLRAEGIIVDASHGRQVQHAPQAPQAPQVQSGRTDGGSVVPLNPRKPVFLAWATRAAAGLALVVGGAVLGRATSGFALAGRTAEGAGVPAPAYSSTDEAMRDLTAAQQRYQTAAAFLAAQDTTSRFIGMNEQQYQTRLVALDEIAAATRAALYRLPQDPMLNQYYLTTLGAREATLRQISGGVASQSPRLERY